MVLRLDFLTKIDKIHSSAGKYYIVVYPITDNTADNNSDSSFSPRVPGGPAPVMSSLLVKTVGVKAVPREVLRVGSDNFLWNTTFGNVFGWWAFKLEHVPPHGSSPIDVGSHNLYTAFQDPDNFDIVPEIKAFADPVSAVAQAQAEAYAAAAFKYTDGPMPHAVASLTPFEATQSNLYLYQTGSIKGQTLVSFQYTSPPTFYNQSVFGAAIGASYVYVATIKADPDLLDGFPNSILAAGRNVRPGTNIPLGAGYIPASLIKGVSNIGNIMNQNISYTATFLVDNVTGKVKRVTPVSTFYPPAGSTAPLIFNGGPYTNYYLP